MLDEDKGTIVEDAGKRRIGVIFVALCNPSFIPCIGVRYIYLHITAK